MWLDALVTNVDRTPQNPNLLWWHRRLWLIDHGAALYWHHSSGGSAADPQAPFAQIADHVLLPYASPSRKRTLSSRRSRRGSLERVVGAPDVWLDGEDRGMYVDYLARRLASPRRFAEEAERARG